MVAPRAAKRLTRQAQGGSRPGVCDRRRNAAGRSAAAAEYRRDEVMKPVLGPGAFLPDPLRQDRPPRRRGLEDPADHLVPLEVVPQLLKFVDQRV